MQSSVSRKPVFILFLCLTAALGMQAAVPPHGASAQGNEAARVSLLQQGQLSGGAAFGLSNLIEALEENGNLVEQVASAEESGGDILVVVGDAASVGTSTDMGAEAFRVERVEIARKPGLKVTGSDERGLMYGLLEIAEQVAHTADPTRPFREVREKEQRPFVPERALSKTVMNQSEFESYFFSEEYWEEYLSMLAKNRFSTFVLLFGYSAAGYFDPPYPFLFDVPAFPDVVVRGLPHEKKQRNLQMLQKIAQMAEQKGLDFTVAIWTHIHRSRRSDVVEGVVENLDAENLIPYTQAGLREFLRRIPNIDALQFRVHVESALTLPEQVRFWSSVLASVKEVRPDIRIDMRVKGFTDDMIDAALASGLEVRLATKYWGEQMGLPFHPTHITTRNQFKRRHGYADLLRYPARYKMHYRLWNLGTTRILQWADPDYVRRFAESTHLYEDGGFEVHEPLGFKMAHQRGQTYALLKPDYRQYGWEFERYWPFFETFGRVAYDPETADGQLIGSFEERFGTDAAPYLQAALYRASRILPRIVAYSLSDLSADHTWAEKQRWEDLPVYVWAEPSDTAQFLGIEEAARFHLENRESPRIWPQQTSRWFTRIADEVRRQLASARARVGDTRSREFATFTTDLEVLAGLADYHSKRIHAGLNYALFEKTQNLLALDEAIEWEKKAISVWEELADLTRDIYADDIVMGRTERLQGNWDTELTALKEGLETLEKERREFEPEFRERLIQFDFGDGPVAAGFEPVISQYELLYPWLPWDKTTNYDRVKGGYGWLHSFLSDPPELKAAEMKREELRDFVSGPDPTSYSYSSFGVDVPSGRYELTFSMSDQSANPKRWGPMWVVANGMDSTGRFEVAPGEVVTKKLVTTVTDDRLTVVFNSKSDSRWLVNSMEVTRLEPVISHIPARRASPGKETEIAAMVWGPDPIRSVRLGYGSETSRFQFLEMEEAASRRFSATLPAATSQQIFYYIEVTDDAGRVFHHPRQGRRKPIEVQVSQDEEPPRVEHEPVRRWPAGKSLPVRVWAHDASGVKWARVRYRGVNQHQDFQTLELLQTAGGVYQAEIPGVHIRPEWDFMYYIEVMDNRGNGKIYPDLELETPYHVVELER